MSPLEYSVFKTACNALNAGAVPAYTPSNYSIIESLEEFAASPANWLSLAVALLGFLAICAVVTLIVFLISTLISCFFESCLPILKRREKALLGDVLGAISGFVICTSIAMSLYKIDMTFSVVFLIPLLQAFDLRERSHLAKAVHGCYVLFLFLASIALTFSFIHLFPQTLFSTCTSFSLMFIGLDVVVIIMYLCIAVVSFCEFLVILNAEKLFIKKKGKIVGNLQKKGKEWIEVYYQKEAEDSDEKKLIPNV